MLDLYPGRENHLRSLALALALWSLPALAQTETTERLGGIFTKLATSSNQFAGGDRDGEERRDRLTRTTLTGADGSYYIGLLPPGSYKITGSHQITRMPHQTPSINNFLIKLAKANLVQRRPSRSEGAVLRRDCANPQPFAATAQPQRIGDWRRSRAVGQYH